MKARYYVNLTAFYIFCNTNTTDIYHFLPKAFIGKVLICSLLTPLEWLLYISLKLVKSGKDGQESLSSNSSGFVTCFTCLSSEGISRDKIGSFLLSLIWITAG